MFDRTLFLLFTLLSFACLPIRVNGEYVSSLDLVEGEPTNMKDYLNDFEADERSRKLMTISNDVESPHIHDEDYWNAMANQPLPEKSCGVYTSSVEIVGATVDSVTVSNFDACCTTCHDHTDCDLFTFMATTNDGGLGSGRCFLKSNDLPWTFFMDADESFISSVADKGIMGIVNKKNYTTSSENVTLGETIGTTSLLPAKGTNKKLIQVKFDSFIIRDGTVETCALSCLTYSSNCIQSMFLEGYKKCVLILKEETKTTFSDRYKIDLGYTGPQLEYTTNIIHDDSDWYGCNTARPEDVHSVALLVDREYVDAWFVTRGAQRMIYTLDYPGNDVDYPGYEPVNPDLDVSVTCQQWCQSQVLCGGFTQDGKVNDGGTCTFYGKDSTLFNPNNYQEQEVQYQYERRCGFDWPFNTSVLGGIIAGGTIGLMLIICGIWFGVKRWRNKRNQGMERQQTVSSLTL